MKLVKEISWHFIMAAVISFFVAVPFLYLGLRYIIDSGVDAELLHQKQWIIHKLKSERPDDFTSFNNSISISKQQNLPNPDSLFSEDIYVEQDSDFVPHRVLITGAIVNGVSYAIRIQKSLLEKNDILFSVMALLVFIIFILFVSLYYVNQAVSKKIWKPFYSMIDSLSRFRVDKENLLTLQHSSVTEFKQLRSSLLKLAATNRKLFASQKTFTENASHELQTPIAVIRANIDLLIQAPELTSSQAASMENIQNAADKIARLNKALLLLARIENHSFEDVSEVNFAELVNSFLQRNQEALSNKKLSVQNNYSGIFIVELNKDLAEILVSNLLSNAIRHTDINGEIYIESYSNELIISNTAMEKSLEESKLFQRFQSQSGNPESIGLGLEICHQICLSSDLHLKYDFLENRHIFKVIKNREKID